MSDNGQEQEYPVGDYLPNPTFFIGGEPEAVIQDYVQESPAGSTKSPLSVELLSVDPDSKTGTVGVRFGTAGGIVPSILGNVPLVPLSVGLHENVIPISGTEVNEIHLSAESEYYTGIVASTLIHPPGTFNPGEFNNGVDAKSSVLLASALWNEDAQTFNLVSNLLGSQFIVACGSYHVWNQI